jgi:hypothetical protein
MTAAQKVKDASDRKEADAKRQAIRTEFANATADRDAAQEELDEFKAQWDSFGEDTELNADDQATFEELEAAFAEADTAY